MPTIDVTMKTNPPEVFDAVRARKQAIIKMMGPRHKLARLPLDALLDTLTVIAFDDRCTGTLSDFHLHGRDFRPQEFWDDVTAQICQLKTLAEDDRLEAMNDALGRGYRLASGAIGIHAAWHQKPEPIR